MPEKGHRYAAKVDLKKPAADQPYLHVSSHDSSSPIKVLRVRHCT